MPKQYKESIELGISRPGGYEFVRLAKSEKEAQKWVTTPAGEEDAVNVYKTIKTPKTSKYPSVQRKCQYCKLMFQTKPTYNGSQMKFCCSQHRKAFDKEGEQPIHVILRKQERWMRQIAREETESLMKQYIKGTAILDWLNSPEATEAILKLKTAPSPNVLPASPQSV